MHYPAYRRYHHEIGRQQSLFDYNISPLMYVYSQELHNDLAALSLPSGLGIQTGFTHTRCMQLCDGIARACMRTIKEPTNTYAYIAFDGIARSASRRHVPKSLNGQKSLKDLYLRLKHVLPCDSVNLTKVKQVCEVSE